MSLITESSPTKNVESVAPIPMTPGYFANLSGAIFRIAGNGAYREIKSWTDSRGYLSTKLTVGSKRKSFCIHWLVASAFLPERPSIWHEIRHLDGNRQNPHAYNLQWGTRKENADDCKKHREDREFGFYFPAIRSLLEIGELLLGSKNALMRGVQSCQTHDANALGLALAVMRDCAQTIAGRAQALEDRLSADDFESATQAYGD